jgi:hypothetical protein
MSHQETVSVAVGPRADLATHPHRPTTMAGENLEGRYPTTVLRVVLCVIGLFFIVGIHAASIVWPAGWDHGFARYAPIIVGEYAAVGGLLLAAAYNPLAHRKLIWFAVAQSLVHGGIVTVQAVINPAQREHLAGGAFMAFVGITLASLMLRTQQGGRDD